MQNRYIKQKNSAPVSEHTCYWEDHQNRLSADRDAHGYYKAMGSAPARISEEHFGDLTEHDGQVIIIF